VWDWREGEQRSTEQEARGGQGVAERNFSNSMYLPKQEQVRRQAVGCPARRQGEARTRSPGLD